MKEVPHMACPQEKQLKQQRQEVKEEHDTRFLEGEEHLHFDGNVYEDWMDTIASPQHFQHLQQHLQQHQQQTQEGLHAIELQIEMVETQPSFEVFKPLEIQVSDSRPKSVKGFPFEFELRRKMVQKMGSFVEGSKNCMTQTSTQKSMEEMVVKVMQANKVVKLFQTMAIMNLNVGNLTLEVNNLNNILAIGEKEKVILQEELDKEKKFKKGYKHNVEIQRKNKVEAEQKIKMFIKKRRMIMRSSRITQHC